MLNNVNIDECQKKKNVIKIQIVQDIIITKISDVVLSKQNCPCPGTVENGYVYYRKGSEPCQINKIP